MTSYELFYEDIITNWKCLAIEAARVRREELMRLGGAAEEAGWREEEVKGLLTNI